MTKELGKAIMHRPHLKNKYNKYKKMITGTNTSSRVINALNC